MMERGRVYFTLADLQNLNRARWGESPSLPLRSLCRLRSEAAAKLDSRRTRRRSCEGWKVTVPDFDLNQIAVIVPPCGISHPPATHLGRDRAPSIAVEPRQPLDGPD